MTIKTVCFSILGVKLLDENFVSTLANVDQVVCGSVDISWSGADGEGSIVLQGSNFRDIESSWQDLCEDPYIISGSTGHHLVQIDKFGYQWLRAKYTNSSNTVGTATVSFRGKTGL